MSDTSTNKFTAMGTTAERTAFVPDPGTPTPTPAQGYTFFDTDDSTLYAWDGAAWQPATTGTGDVTASGTLTAGLVVIGDGGTAVDVLAAGSDGNVLTQAGGVAAWASPSTGSLILLEQHTASSSASLDFTSCISSTYDDYLIELVNVLPATNGQDLLMRMGSGSYDSGANYTRLGWYNGTSDVFTSVNTTGATSILIASSVRNSANNLTLNGSWRFYGPSNTGAFKQALGSVSSFAVADSRLYRWDLSGSWNSLTAPDRFQFLFASGNIASGTIRVYGLAK